MGNPTRELSEAAARLVDLAKAAGADQAEVYASRARTTEAGLQKNDLDQVRVADETTLGVRVFVGGRPGFATTNQLHDLSDLASEAVTMARAAPADDHAGLPPATPLPPSTDHVDPALLEQGPGELARLALDLLAQLRGRDPRVTVDTASVAVTVHAAAIASSEGVSASHQSASASGSVFGMAVDGDEVGSFSYDGDRVRRWQDLAPALDIAFGRFVDNCVGALGATEGESFRGPIVLPPSCVASFLVYDLLSSLGADTVREGRSAFAERTGDAIAVPGFSLIEAGPGLDGFPLAPFDREGQPRRRRALVDGGVLQTFLYDSYEARAAGRTFDGCASAGHASGSATSPPRVGASAVAIAAGEMTPAQLEAVDRGVVVTRFSGSTNTVTGDFSGVVKGGFLISGGERRPIRETTIAGNLWQCLHQISGIGADATTFHGTQRFPSLRIEDVSITAG